jgi:hypothetical protein
MREFYDTGEARGMFGFFADTAKNMYSHWDLKKENIPSGMRVPNALTAETLAKSERGGRGCPSRQGRR